MKIEIFSRRTLLQGKQWYFRIKARNGQKLAQSEGYYNRADCRQTAQLLRDGMATATIHCRIDGVS
jgi:uncharacterized protein YegP (UPF0339 family)